MRLSEEKYDVSDLECSADPSSLVTFIRTHCTSGSSNSLWFFYVNISSGSQSASKNLATVAHVILDIDLEQLIYL